MRQDRINTPVPSIPEINTPVPSGDQENQHRIRPHPLHFVRPSLAINPMRTQHAPPAVAAVTIATVLLIVTACSQPAPIAEAIAATPVTLISVTDDSIVQPIIATGTFGPRDEVPLAFKIGGVVARVMVDEGATVTRGQVLAVLDLREIDALVAKARIGAEKAARDQARLDRLHTDSVATLSQLQDATSAADAARSDLASALVNREYATIVAPGNGVILRRLVTAGTTTGPGTSVLTLASNERGRVLRVGLPDRDALRMRTGDKASAQFDAIPGKTFYGRVTLLGRAADARTGTYVAEVSLDNSEVLPAGLIGRVTLSPQAAAIATLVPMDALVEADADSAIIYSASTDKAPLAQRHAVRILFVSGDQVAVQTTASKAALARVVSRGAQYLTHDMPVRIVTSEGVDVNQAAVSPTHAATKAETVVKVRP